MRVSRWTKDGWKTDAATKEQIAAITSFGANVPRSFDLDFTSRKSELDLVAEIQNEVPYGPPGLKVDELPNAIKQVLYASDAFYIKGGKCFKIVDPLTRAMEVAGTMSDERDFDPFEQSQSSAREFIEQIGLIDKAETSEDILGAIQDDDSIIESPFYRANIDLSLIINSHGELDNEDSDTCYDEDDYSVQNHEYAGYLPELPTEVVREVQKLNSERLSMLSKAKGNEDLVIEKAFDQAIDNTVGKFITAGINSPFCGRGYTAPSKRYIPIQVDQEMTSSTAADERKKFFHEMLSLAATCESYDDLFGKVQLDLRPNITLGVKHNNDGDNTLDIVPNPDYNKYHRIGGFVSMIRGMYRHDKEICTQWSDQDKKDDKGNVIAESAFTRQRKESEKTLREMGFSEESIQRRLWVLFDRRRRDIEYKKASNGKLVVDDKARPIRYRASKDSRWYQDRSVAFEDLFLTTKQWRTIYNMVNVVKSRANLKPDDPTRLTTLDNLAAYFGRIDNLSNLNSYMRWAQKRTIKDDRIIPSKIDRITIRDEYKWRQSCTKKRCYIINRMVKFQALRDSVIAERETSLPEQTLTCMDPKCDSMAIGTPVWFDTGDQKGLLGVRCDGCGKIVWALGHKEDIIPKTYDELTQAKIE